jgi:hypothetical protein
MERHLLRVVSALLLCILAGSAGAAPPPAPSFTWTTVVNNADQMPFDSNGRTFNSYNQPSVNVNGVVVIRARSRGGEGQGQGAGMPTHGIYIRDMLNGVAVERILDRKVEVPAPNNVTYPVPQGHGATSPTRFIETPSFPRIDMWSNTIATRGNHQPVWQYGAEPEKTRVGTTGIYTNPFDHLITGASKLGEVPEFSFFAVPGVIPATMFDVFPGSPSVTNRSTIVFKGNYTTGGAGRTGVFFRELVDGDVDGKPGGGSGPVKLIANNTETKIPGTDQVFGSTSTPSAADGMVVFAGFDNEEAPTVGGIYLAPVDENPGLTPLVKIGDRVPGESVRSTFNRLGEGTAFDGRYVGFWGAWGTETATVRLYCPKEGNKDRIAYCNQALVCADTGDTKKDPNTANSDEVGYYQDVQVPVRQGIFVHDTLRNRTYQVAKTGSKIDDFQYWTYSGRTPCVGSSGHGEEGAEDDGEFVRWRSSAFVAVSGIYTAFKATGRGVTGIYLGNLEDESYGTVLSTGMAGQTVDPEAPDGSLITELGLEREGLRGRWLVISAKMGVAGGTEEEGMAGIYLTTVTKK